jgi:hypothetical protein
MITYTWKIETIKAINDGAFKNAIVQVYWTKTGTTEDNKTGVFKSCTSFSTNDILSEKFVDIKDVSEEMIIDWIKSGLSEDATAYINAAIESQCNA